MVSLSLITNRSANIAIRQLDVTNRQLQKTQLRITTGLRVSGPQDDAATYSIATRLRGDLSGAKAVKEALADGEAIVDTAVAGANAVIDLLAEIKSKVVQANQTGLDATTRTALNTDLVQLLNQLTTTVQSAELSNVNLIKTQASTLNILSSIDGSVISVSAQILDVTVLGINTVALLTTSAAANALTAVTTAVTLAASKAAALGSSARGVEIQADFNTSLVNVIQEGIGNMVDADLAEESARLQALQIQQELSVQALNIANAAPQLIVDLFSKVNGN